MPPVFLSLVLLSACGSSDGENSVASLDENDQQTSDEGQRGSEEEGQTVPQAAHFSGFLGVEEFASGGNTVAIAQFTTSSGTPEFFEMEPDTCLPFATGPTGLVPKTTEIGVSAGESVILSSSSGTVGTMPIDDATSDFPSYRLDFPPNSMELSQALTVSSTGDGAFPASSFEVPAVEEIRLQENPSDALFSKVFSWVRGASSDAIIVIRFTIQESASGGGKRRDFTCRAEDDGEFELPESVEIANEEIIASASISREMTLFSITPQLSWYTRRTSAVFF